MDTTVAIGQLRACLAVAMGIVVASGCEEEHSCPLTARAVETSYVCFDPTTQAPVSHVEYRAHR